MTLGMALPVKELIQWGSPATAVLIIFFLHAQMEEKIDLKLAAQAPMIEYAWQQANEDKRWTRDEGLTTRGMVGDCNQARLRLQNELDLIHEEVQELKEGFARFHGN
jgi:hypothetical protein